MLLGWGRRAALNPPSLRSTLVTPTEERPGTTWEMVPDRLQQNSRGWTRTSDKTVNSRLLYQLSYAGSVSTK